MPPTAMDVQICVYSQRISQRQYNCRERDDSLQLQGHSHGHEGLKQNRVSSGLRFDHVGLILNPFWEVR